MSIYNNIYKEEDGSYRISYDRLIDGKRIRVRKKGFKSELEANNYLKKTIKERNDE